MGRDSKKLYWAGAGAVLLLAILLALAAVVPRIVDSAWLKKTIRTEVGNKITGDFDFHKAELFILPVPAVSLQQVSLSIPETVQIHLDTLKVYPKLLPLLLGNIEIAKIVVDSPDFSLPLPQQQDKKKKQGEYFSLSAALEAVSAKLSPVLSAIPNLEIGVLKGTLHLSAAGDEIFLFENINGSFAVSPNSLTSTVSCRSNIWETMELHATLEPDSGTGNGRIFLEHINSKVIADYFLGDKLPSIDGSLSSLQADFSVSPEIGLKVDIQGTGVSLALVQGNEKVTATIETLKGSIQHSDQISSINVEDLTLSYPQVQLRGSFIFDQTAPHAGLDIKLQNADIAPVREVLPVFINAFYGDQPVVREIFDIARGGKISQASFQVEGKSLADLAVFESLLIQGRLENADITLSDLGLDLQGVTGDVTIAHSILEGKNLQAKLGKTTGSDGTLKIGLVQKETIPFQLDLDLNADLAEVLPLLKKMVPEKQVLEYLSLLESIEGTSQGRLTLGESLQSFSVRVEANKIFGQAKYKPIPYPVSINGGRILYDGLKTHSFNLQGKVGRSTFSNYSSLMNFEGEPTIKVESGTFNLVLDEIFPWLAKDKRLEDDLRNIKSMAGMAELTVKDVEGPLLQPASLEYALQCDFKDVELTATGLPGPLKLKSGRAQISPDRTLFENLQANLLDSSLTFSGVLQNYITGKTNAEIIMTDAEIGPEVNGWFSEEIEVPKEYIFRTPLLVSRSQVKWAREELLDLQGDFSIKDGPIFSIDIMLNPDELVLRSLALKNGDEQAKIKLALKRREIGAEFQGSLSKNTIDNILLHNDAFPEAWIEGDIKFDIYLDSPATSVATGNLDGGDFIFPWKPDKPIRLQSFSLSAADKTLTFNSGVAVLEGTKYAMNGQASLAREFLSMDFDVKTGIVELDKIIGALKNGAEDEKRTEKRIGKSWDFGVKAQVNFLADSMLYNGYTWEPFESRVTYENSALGIEIIKAELCNLSTPGKLSFQDGQISLDFTMKADEQEFKEILICLEGGEQQMTGILDLKATIRGKGTRETLVSSLEGNLQYSSKEGYIYQDAQAAKLLSLLNVTDMFKGKIPDLRSKGFPYDSLIVKGTMEKGILTITPAKLDAPIMEISAYGTIDIPSKRVVLQVLVAPLQTVNKLQKMLPVISTIIPSSIVALPVEVSGDFSDIKVRTLSMSAISKSAFDFMMDALLTPVRVLEGNSPE